MRAPPVPVDISDFGPDGLRIACRPGTIDHRAVGPWRRWLAQSPPREGEFAPSDTILDVGAHVGGFTLLAAGIATSGRVLAVEACRESYEMLRYNIDLNGLTNVEAEHLALADREGEERLYYDPEGNWGHTITKPLRSGAEPVRAESLAGYLAARGVQHCDLAKLNCEGAEFPILMGADVETLRSIRRLLVFYHVDLVEPPFSLEALEGHLRGAGFELEHLGGGRAHGYFSAELSDAMAGAT